MALNTHAVRFVKNRKHRVTVEGSVQIWDGEQWNTVANKAATSIRGIDQFTFEAHVKVGAGATSLTDRAYCELQGGKGIRFACAPTRNGARSVLNFEFARVDGTLPVLYSYVVPNGWDDRWHHVAFSVSTGDAKYAIFFDGNKVREGTLVDGGRDAKDRPLLVAATEPAAIHFGASMQDGKMYFWDGKLDNVRLWRKWVNGATYDSEEAPIDDHVPLYGGLTKDSNLIEEWRFNEGPLADNGAATQVMAYGVVDHQYDPELKSTAYAKEDTPPDDNQEEDTGDKEPPDFDPKVPQIAKAKLFADGTASTDPWIGDDVSAAVAASSGIPALAVDFDRPFLGEGRIDITPPSMPLALKTSAVTEDSFEVSWNHARDDVYVQNYQLDVSTQSSFATTVFSENIGRRTSLEVGGLNPGMRYYWRVRAEDSGRPVNVSPWASTSAYRRYTRQVNNAGVVTSRFNHCTNPSFEGLNGLFGWFPYAQNGALASLSIGTYATADFDAPEDNRSLYGEHFLTISRTPGNVGFKAGTYFQRAWRPNRQFTCSFWFRGTGRLSVYAQTLDEWRVLKTYAAADLHEGATNHGAVLNGAADWKRLHVTITPAETKMNRLRLFFVCPNIDDFTFHIDGVLFEDGTAVGSYFDGSHRGAYPAAYWVYDNADDDGYVVGDASGVPTTALSFTDQSASAVLIDVRPATGVQTLDFSDRTAPDPPDTANLTFTAATDVTSTGFRAKWKHPAANYEDVIGWELQVALKSMMGSRLGLFVPGYELLAVSNPASENGVFYRDIVNLLPMTTYYYRVRAFDSNRNYSDWSTVQAISTEAPLDVQDPTEPVVLEADEITFDSFTAHWLASLDDVGVVGYRLTVAKDPEFTALVEGYVERTVGNVLAYEVTGLDPDTAYFYRVQAFDAAGNSSNYATTGNYAEVRTLIRDVDAGGYQYERVAPALVEVRSATPSVAVGETATVTLTESGKDAVLQWSLYQTVPNGLIASATLNLTRVGPTGADLIEYTLTPLAVPVDPLAAYFTPSSVTYANKPADALSTSWPSKTIRIRQPAQSGQATDVLSLDVTDLVQRGAVAYGLRLSARRVITADLSARSRCDAVAALAKGTWTDTGREYGLTALTATPSLTARPTTTTTSFSVVLGGSAATADLHKPELVLAIDTSTLLSLARARTTSASTLARNLYPNPTFDTTAQQHPLGNGSFTQAGTARWLVTLDPTVTATTTLSRALTSYDAQGGSGELVIADSSAGIGVGAVRLLHRRLVPATPGLTYTVRAALATDTTTIIPRLAVFRYDADGLLLGYSADSNSFSPASGVWYQRTHSYTVAANDATTAYVQFGVVTQTTVALALGVLRVDAAELFTNASDLPVAVSKLGGSSVTLSRDTTTAYAAGADALPVSLKVRTTAANAGVVLDADIDESAGWLAASYADATINYVANPSFEDAAWQSAVTYSGTASEVTREAVLGAQGTYALKTATSAATSLTVTASMAAFPAAGARTFAASFWLRGAHTFWVALKAVYTDATETVGTAKQVTGSADWQRITAGAGGTVTVTTSSTKTLASLKLVITLVNDAATAKTWYLDGVQIEPVASTTAAVSAYCDGDQAGCLWHGVPHRSLSFRNAYLAAVRVRTDTAPALAGYLKLVLENGTTLTSPVTTIATLPPSSTNAWFLLRTQPVIPVGASASNRLTRAEFVLYATNGSVHTYYLDAAGIYLNADGRTFFHGASQPVTGWEQDPFNSPSDQFGVQISARVHTTNTQFDRGRIQTWFTTDTLGDQLQQDDDILLRYERDARYADVRFPPTLRWNEIGNPTFTASTAGWVAEGASLSRKLSTTATAVARLSVTDPATAAVINTDLTPALPGERWSFQTMVRSVEIARTGPIGLAAGLLFYDAAGTVIATETVPFTLGQQVGWTLVGNTAAAPAGTVWVRGCLRRHAFTGGYGLLAGEQIEFSRAMLYRGPFNRLFLSGNQDTDVVWEGRQFASPALFCFRPDRPYSLRYMASDDDGVLLGDPLRQEIRTLTAQADVLEIQFTAAVPVAHSRMIELLVPYAGTNTQNVTLVGQYRRADRFERHPLLVEHDPVYRRFWVRAEHLAPNRDYVLELRVVAEDESRVRGDLTWVTRLSTALIDPLLASIEGDGTIKFDGFALNGPSAQYYWVESQDSFGLPERRMQFEKVPRMDGSVELRDYWGTKKIKLKGGVWGSTRAHLYDNLNLLKAALTAKSKPLQIDTLANHNDHYLATCTDFTVSEAAGETLHALAWDATFECADPFLYRDAPVTDRFTIVASKPANPLDLLYTDDQRFVVNNMGTVYTYPRYTLTGVKGSSNYTVVLHNETTGEHIMPRTTITKDDVLLIDTKTLEVKKNAKLAVDYVGSFPRLQPGVNTLRVSVKDLSKSRFNLLMNPGAEKGDADLGFDVGIYPSYNYAGADDGLSAVTTTTIAGTAVTKTRYSVGDGSSYAAQVRLDGTKPRQGVVFRTEDKLAQEQNWASGRQRTFSATAYVRTSMTNRVVELDDCFIRIWYTDNRRFTDLTNPDGSKVTITPVRLTNTWKLMQVSSVISDTADIDYVEVIFRFAQAQQGDTTFMIDNVVLVQDNLNTDDTDAEFALDVTYQERFI